MPEKQPVVELAHVYVYYQNVLAIEDVSLAVWPGQFLAIIGPNGSGKTTLLKAMLGLIPIVSGEIRLFGRHPQAMGKMRQAIGYVPQITKIDYTFPVTVFNVVMMGLFGQMGLFRWPKKADKEKVWRALKRMDIADLAHRQIGALSGGQRQRVFLARALVANPKLLILDEPTTGVDSSASSNLYDLLLQLHREGMTIILVSHDIGVVAEYADQIACMNRRLIAHGRPREVLNGEVLSCMYGPEAGLVTHGAVPHIVLPQHTHDDAYFPGEKPRKGE